MSSIWRMIRARLNVILTYKREAKPKKEKGQKGSVFILTSLGEAKPKEGANLPWM